MDPDLRGINSSRGEIDVTFHTRVDYAGTTRSSAVQLFSATEMRAGELFMTPQGFSSHFGTIQNNTVINTYGMVEEKGITLMTLKIFHHIWIRLLQLQNMIMGTENI